MRKIIPLLLFVACSIVASAQETFDLSNESTLTIDGTSTLHDWSVTANTMEGTVSEDSNNISEIGLSVLVKDILSDRAAAMDNKMHAALKKEEHPNVQFTMGGANAAVDGKQDLKGTLTIAGVAKEVTVPTNIKKEDGKLQISGEQKIVLEDYGMEPPTAMFGSIVVGDEVTVKFDLVFSND